jgi:hypothetical protein
MIQPTTDTSISDLDPIEREELTKKISQLDRYLKKVQSRIQYLSINSKTVSDSVVAKIHDYSQRQEPHSGGYSHEC